MTERESPEKGAPTRWLFSAAFLPFLVILAVLASPASASIRHHHAARGGWGPGPTDPEKDAALILDGATGKVLYSRNADATRHPASLTKMMTLYLLFEQLKNGQLTLATPLPVSEHAAIQHRTKLYLRAGTTIPVESAIKAIVVCSANDVAVAIAEAIGGSESHFAELMTDKARQLGMTHTFYHNASGLPDDAQITSAGDLAILARHLAYDFPQYFPYFSTQTFYWHGELHQTTDHLLGAYEGADGIKTGYTQASGFNLVSSVVRGGAHVIAVVMGGRTARRRDREMVNLLDGTFADINRNPTLVARTNVPWQSVAQNTQPNLAIAGFQIGSAGVMPRSPSQEQASNAPQSNVATDPDDEAAAESRVEPDELPLRPAPAASQPPPPSAPVYVAKNFPQPVRVIGLSSSSAKPEFAPPRPIPRPQTPVLLAAYHPATPAPAKTHLPIANVPGIASMGVSHTIQSAQNIRDWTIQIGAFGDEVSAKAQLSAYAEKSMDVLGQASRIVLPFQAVDGHTLYRARFGPFAEREAREVCERLTERGQTCFAAIAEH